MTSNSSAIVGIEVSKLWIKAVLLLHGETYIKALENDLAGYRWLRSWLARHDVACAGLPVCMAMNGAYAEAPALVFAGMGMTILNADAGALEQFRLAAMPQQEMHGPQSALALLLARFGEAGLARPWQAPPAAELALRLGLQRLKILKLVRAQEQGRSDAHLRSGQHALFLLLQRQIACIDEQIGQEIQEIDAHIRRHPAFAVQMPRCAASGVLHEKSAQAR